MTLSDLGELCTQALGNPGLLPQALELLQLLGKAAESPGQVWDQHSALSLGEPPTLEMPETHQVPELLQWMGSSCILAVAPRGVGHKEAKLGWQHNEKENNTGLEGD